MEDEVGRACSTIGGGVLIGHGGKARRKETTRKTKKYVGGQYYNGS
jgi:hypothetical protein